jgi:hypothetical protein
MRTHRRVRDGGTSGGTSGGGAITFMSSAQFFFEALPDLLGWAAPLGGSAGGIGAGSEPAIGGSGGGAGCTIGTGGSSRGYGCKFRPPGGSGGGAFGPGGRVLKSGFCTCATRDSVFLPSGVSSCEGTFSTGRHIPRTTESASRVAAIERGRSCDPTQQCSIVSASAPDHPRSANPPSAIVHSIPM